MTGETTASGPGSVAAQTVRDSTITTNVNLPPPPAPPSALRQLPGDLPEFTGRAAELLALTTALDRDSGATVAITALRGMGGVGKTTLAQHAARRLTHRYPDGQIVVDLNGHGVGAPTTPIEAMQRVIRAFTPTLPPLDDVAQARAIYRDTLNGKRVLILLDNAADTDQIRDLIPPPHCGALITARELVQPPGCTVLRLDLLPLDESVELLRALAPAAAGEDADWRRLADRCGLLPLALRVAGSVLATAEDLTLPGYLAELADEATRPHRLTIDGDASANVAAVLSHSLRRLVARDPTLAARWQILSVFPADFDRAAAAALWEEPADSAAPILRGLLARSLLFYDKARDRYRLHDLMRPLARSLFDPDPAQDPTPGTVERTAMAEARFALYFMGVLEEASALLSEGHSAILKGFALYDRENLNIFTAYDWALCNFQENSISLKMISHFPYIGSTIFRTRIHPEILVKFLKIAIDAAKFIGDEALVAAHFRNIGVSYSDLGQNWQAIKFYENSLLIISKIYENENAKGPILNNLGLSYSSIGKTKKAIKMYRKSLIICRNSGDKLGRGYRLSNLGLAYAKLGKHKVAINLYKSALAISQDIGDRIGEGQRLGNLANSYAELDDFLSAIEFYIEAIIIADEINDNRGKGLRLCNIGYVFSRMGNLDTAIDLTKKGILILESIGSPDAETFRRNLALYHGQHPQG